MIILTQRHEQDGFMPKRSTIDRIIGQQVLIERHLKFRRSFLVAYVDFEKALDSVDKG